MFGSNSLKRIGNGIFALSDGLSKLNQTIHGSAEAAAKATNITKRTGSAMMTIKGVKKALNNNRFDLDENLNPHINTINNNIKIRLNKVSKILKSLKQIKQMAKKTHVKVRLVPEAKPDSPFFYYVKKPAGGEKAKVKLSAKKYNPDTKKHEMFVEKKLPPHSK